MGKHLDSGLYIILIWCDTICTIYILHYFHIAVQESDDELRIKGCREMLPYFFALNLTNYSRYASYYVCMMSKIDELFPGNKELLKTYGISVPCQDIRTAIHQRGEQTLNRDAKMAGGIGSFAADESNVRKLTLNRSEVANITHALKEFSGLTDSDYQD